MLLYQGRFKVYERINSEPLTIEQLDEMAEQIEGTFDALADLVEEKYPGVKASWD